MPRGPWLGVGLVLAAMGLAAWLVLPEEPAPSEVAAAQGRRGVPAASAGGGTFPAEPSSGGAPAASSDGTSRRTPIPRPASPASASGSPASAGSAAGPTWKGGEAPPPTEDGGEAVGAIRLKMDEVREQIRPCIEAWTEFDSSLAGKVSLGFRIDDLGLQEVWIAEHSDVPAGPLSCFSSAIWGVDWAGIASGEDLEVTMPFVFTAD